MCAREIVIYAVHGPREEVASVHYILDQYRLPYRDVWIDRDPAALGRVLLWTGNRSVPTLVAADHGQVDPYQPPLPIKSWTCPRGVDRGSMISEPSRSELLTWLQHQGFITS
jgi:hypothetical protein